MCSGQQYVCRARMSSARHSGKSKPAGSHKDGDLSRGTAGSQETQSCLL